MSTSLSTIELFLTGAVAGLGVAVPLGAIGVLLIRQGVAGGFRRGSAGALAVSLVDSVYCAAALVLGAVAAPWVQSLGSWPAVIGGGLLVSIGVLGIARAMGSTTVATSGPESRSGSRVFWTFFGLTAVNPATLVYFAAVVTAVNTESIRGPGAVAVVVGVGCASVAWQLLLVWIGARLGDRVSAGGQRLISTVGFGLVVVMGGAALTVALV